MPAVLLLVVGLALTVRGYRRWPSGTGWARWGAPGLKLFAFALLAACLLEPVWVGQEAEPGANIFVVLADDSRSLTVAEQDAPAGENRGTVFARLLRGPDDPTPGTAPAEPPAWLAGLEEAFQVRRYQFDERLRRVTDYSALRFEGKASALATVLDAIRSRYTGKPLAGILLLSDGNATDGAVGDAVLDDLPPIYPVLPPGPGPGRDLALGETSTSQTSFEDAPVTLRVEAHMSGYAGQTVAVRLADANGATLRLKRHPVQAAEESESFLFQFRPEKPGVSFFQVEIYPDDGSPADAPAPHITGTGEATAANNRTLVAVDRGRGPYRVLYVGGRPNWEYKFLRRAVEEDPEISLVGLLRVAKREPKFQWRGRAGERSNPLFRGFKDKDAEDTGEYDQPVLVRLQALDGDELRDGFPKKAEELFAYRALILDDLESGFFTHDQMELVQQFVSRRGGGFLMLGGQDSLRQGKFENTPIGRLLPVYLDRLPASPTRGGVRLDLTREGWLQPWVRLRDNEEAERQRLEGMPEFRVLNRVRAIKPGASVIATVTREGGGSYPGLVVHRFGAGRAAALTVGDLWRWGLRDEALRDDMEKAWRQLLRWLVADVPDRLDVEVATAGPGTGPGTGASGDIPRDAVRLRVRARDREFFPATNAAVNLTVTAPVGDPVEIPAEPVLEEPGLFEAVFLPRDDGAYEVAASLVDATGETLAEAASGWAVNREADEFRSLHTDRAALQRLAERTGGETLAPGEIEHFAATLPEREMPITATTERPLWHLPGVFLLALACFAGEWVLRRSHGLP